jgi:hypothetical protein
MDIGPEEPYRMVPIEPLVALMHAYFRHRNIQNTTRYTALAPERFKGFWKD